MWWKGRRQRRGDRRGTAVVDGQKASFTSRGFWRGVRLGLPFAATSLVHGLLFGVVALEAELAVWDAVMMSSLVASGSSVAPCPRCSPPCRRSSAIRGPTS